MTSSSSRSFSFFGSVLAVLAGILLAGCRGPEPPLPSALAVSFAGCKATLVPGPICVLDSERKLTLWVPTPPETTVEIRTAGRQIVQPGESIDEGLRYTLKIPAGAERIEVTRTGPGSSRAVWSLRVAEIDVQDKINLGTQGTMTGTGQGTFDQIQRLELNEARAHLAALESLAPASSRSAESRYLLAFSRCLLADKEGDFRTALSEIDRSIQEADRGSLADFGWTARHKRALLLTDLGRHHEAAEIYGELAVDHPETRSDCSQGLLLNNWAWATLLARESSAIIRGTKLEEPIPLLEEAAVRTNRAIQTAPGTCGVSQPYLIQLNQLLAYLQEGRFELAAEALAKARGLNQRAPLVYKLWEIDLDARLDLAQQRPESALKKYQELGREADEAGSPDGLLRSALGGARSLEALDRPADALASLKRADKLLDRQSLQVPLHEGRGAFVSQREAIASLEIRLLLDAHRVSEALATTRSAQSRVLRQVALGERLASLSPTHRKTWGELIARYRKARSEVDEAEYEKWRLLATEENRGRAARAKRADEAAKDLDQAFSLLQATPASPILPPLRPGELLLTFHPLPGREWVAFAADGTEAFYRFELTRALLEDKKALARYALEPFHEQILKAQRIRVLPYGVLRTVDFQTLPFDGNILLAAKPVIYGLDLSPLPGRDRANQSASNRELTALVVADPSANLPGTRDEAEAVTREIERWGSSYRVSRLTASEAEVEVVREKLLAADLFHFSGHGMFGGVSGWNSGLVLSAGRRLTVGELLVLGRSPRRIVLSGCDTGLSSGEDQVDGIGLAQAFVLSGAEEVIASVRTVDDRTAPAFFSDLYRRWGGTTDLASALQQVQLAWRLKNPQADWASFRIIEP